MPGVAKTRSNGGLTGEWRAYIEIDRKQISLGTRFTTEERAQEARAAADQFRRLQTLDLSYCDALTSLPSLAGLTGLQTLNLERCSGRRCRRSTGWQRCRSST